MFPQTKQIILTAYQKHYQGKPGFLVTAPGRINLIGEHTDYSEGFVLPVAINRDITIAFTPREDRLIKAFSQDFNENIQLDLDQFQRNQDGWAEYIKGTAWALTDAGYHLQGWQGVIAGNIPAGAGLSSSAAFLVAVAKTFCLASNITLTPTDLAVISRNAESDWVGVNVGIMDQLISAAGKENHAVLLDCRSLDYEYIPIPSGISLVVMDTMTRRELTYSDYNTRHEEVRKASQILSVNNLRAANLQLLQEKQAQLPQKLFQRAKHVITENKRVLSFVNSMRNRDVLSMGKLINESHASLRDDFEVSSQALNLIVDLAVDHPHCLGARMMGAGFGGCALALLRNDDFVLFRQVITRNYRAETGLEPQIFAIKSTDGVRGHTLSA
jgi:galactokinase